MTTMPPVKNAATSTIMNDSSSRSRRTSTSASSSSSNVRFLSVVLLLLLLAASLSLALSIHWYSSLRGGGSTTTNDNDNDGDYDDDNEDSSFRQQLLFFDHRTLLQSQSSSDSSSSSSTHHHDNLHHHRHKPLLPLDATDQYGFVYATIGLMIAAGGGIGGGGVLVPIYILVMHFSPKHAIPLSNITILGGALANTILNLPKRHPLANRPLVDWDLILVMEPPAIAGALVGAILNKVLPEGVVMISLVVLLSYTAYETLKKAIRMYKAETRAFVLAEKSSKGTLTPRVRPDGTKESELTVLAREMEEERENEKQVAALLSEDIEEEEGVVGKQTTVVVGENHPTDELDQSSNNNIICNSTTTTVEGVVVVVDVDAANDAKDVEDGRFKQSNDHMKNEEDEDEDEEYSSSTSFSSATELRNKEDLARILQEEKHIPMGNIKALFLTLAVVIVINLLKGGGAYTSPLGIQCGTTSYWIANGSMILWILIVMIYARRYLEKRHRMKERCGYPYVEGDIKWDSRATIVYPIICSAAGFCAGMFGIGGGIVKGPLMLAMGVHPKVASAASACMILLTAFAATTSFMVFGLLDYEYAGVCIVLGFVATFVGQIGLSYLMQKYQRNSYIAFSIGGIVLLSAFLITIQSLLSLADSGGPRPPSGLCSEQQ